MATKSALALPKLHRILFPTPRYQSISRSAYSSASTRDHEVQQQDHDSRIDPGETADPEPDKNTIPTKENNHYVHPKTNPSNLSSSKLQTPGVNTPIDPHIQQKRKKSTKPEDLTCAGLDGSPWPEEETASREEQEADDKEYFEEHKASPLSKIEVGDTRKPLAKVMDGSSDGYFGDEKKVMSWRPEQLDTAEESLLRAMRMFREAAARGVREYPHSRRLRELRGEDW